MSRFSLSSLKAKIATAAVLLASSAGAMAADGTTATNYTADAWNSLKTTATDMISQAWPIVTVIVVAGLSIRLFKKFSSKAV